MQRNSLHLLNVKQIKNLKENQVTAFLWGPHTSSNPVNHTKKVRGDGCMFRETNQKVKSVHPSDAFFMILNN